MIYDLTGKFNLEIQERVEVILVDVEKKKSKSPKQSKQNLLYFLVPLFQHKSTYRTFRMKMKTKVQPKQFFMCVNCSFARKTSCNRSWRQAFALFLFRDAEMTISDYFFPVLKYVIRRKQHQNVTRTKRHWCPTALPLFQKKKITKKYSLGNNEEMPRLIANAGHERVDKKPRWRLWEQR